MSTEASKSSQLFVEQGYVYAGTVSVDKSVIRFFDEFSQIVIQPEQLFLDEGNARYASAIRANPESTSFNIANLLFEQDPVDQLGLLSEALGQFEVVSRKIVCDLPTRCLPAYVRKLNDSVPNANVTYLVKPYYRFMTYFWGIDFHQDLIDHGYRSNNYVTLYIHLTDASVDNGCLIVLPGSHELGADSFPHDISYEADSNSCTVHSRIHRQALIRSTPIKLVGPAGSSFFWHNALLHGTGTNKTSLPRFTLRYVINPISEQSCVVAANSHIKYPLEIKSTRTDLDPSGKAVSNGNFIKEVLESS